MNSVTLQVLCFTALFAAAAATAGCAPARSSAQESPDVTAQANAQQASMSIPF